MKVKACREFISPVYKTVPKGKVLDVPEYVATSWASIGLVEIQEIPMVAGVEQSSSSPADRAQTKKTRGRRRKKVVS